MSWISVVVNVKLLKLLRKLMNLQQPVWCLRSTAKCNFSINLLCLCLIKHWAFPGLSLTKLQIKCRQVTITLHAHRTKWTTLTAVNTAHQTVSLTCKWNLLNSIFIYTYHKFWTLLWMHPDMLHPKYQDDLLFLMGIEPKCRLKLTRNQSFSQNAEGRTCI